MEIFKSPAGFEILTYKYGVNALTHCASLESDNFGENIYKITLDFIVNSINSSSIWECPIQPQRENFTWNYTTVPLCNIMCVNVFITPDDK